MSDKTGYSTTINLRWSLQSLHAQCVSGSFEITGVHSPPTSQALWCDYCTRTSRWRCANDISCSSSTQSIPSHHQMWPGCPKIRLPKKKVRKIDSSCWCACIQHRSVSGQAGRSAGGFTGQHQNEGRHYLGYDKQATRQTRSPTFFYHWDGAVGSNIKKINR